MCAFSVRLSGSRTQDEGFDKLSAYPLLLHALRRFASDMGRSYDIVDVSHRLGERVTEVLGVAGVGVSVGDSAGALKFVTATSEQINRIELIQDKFQEGPCVSAFRSQEPMVINDLGTISTWPDYKRTAKELQLHAVVGYPLRHREVRLGALDVYSAERKEWSDDDLDVLGVFADMATAYLVRLAELAESRDLAKQLQSALDSRVLIEQAKGMLANGHHIDVDEAFRRIRRYSQDHNLKLLAVCRLVVDDGLKIPEEE
jgi:GAF domain-containing protein